MKRHKRHKFSLSNYKLLSMNMGNLIPICLTEVLPGDSVQQASTALIRLSPLMAPMMHPVHARIHHWFVPHRIVWEDWEDFITGGPDGMDDSVFPTIDMPSVGGAAVGSLADYYGIPPGVASLEVSALPFRGYNLIFNEWYRDQDLTPELPISYESGPDTTTNTNTQNVAWEKDYFTSARPWAQKGPAITIPLGTSAPVYNASGNPQLRANVGGTEFDFNVGADSHTFLGGYAGAGAPINFLPLIADLGNATAANVNLLREAFALQRYEEARARYGSRYTEYLRYLGVRSSDARLQRPEYLGGGRQLLQISEVLQTGITPDSEDLGVGDLRGHGIGALRSNRYRRFFEEHGYIHSFISVKPKTIYAQGLARTWNRRTKEDFWQKELEHIGQQEILNKELYAPGPSPEATFGYQDRYDEYRRSESSIAGQFRTTLDYWHMARIFGSAPALNNAFVNAGDVTERVFQVAGSEDTLWIMAQNSIQARRMVAGTGSSFIY